MDSFFRFWIYIGIILFVVLGVNEIRPRPVFEPQGLFLPLTQQLPAPVPTSSVSFGEAGNGEPPIAMIRVASHNTADLDGLLEKARELAAKAGGHYVLLKGEGNDPSPGVPALSQIVLTAKVYRHADNESRESL